MGALHLGHASLIEQAKRHHRTVVVSIFVNPTQFSNRADFEAYPVTLEADRRFAEAAGADIVFTPQAKDLYQGELIASSSDYGLLTSTYEGEQRSGHFDGVVAVVRHLFRAVQPDVAYFGEKDLQQLAVIQQLAAAEFPALEIFGCPLVREAEGLAMSSRNVRLSAEGHRTALHLSRSIFRASELMKNGTSAEAAIQTETKALEETPGLELEYLDAVDCRTFEAVRQNPPESAHVIVAASVEGVRLIDNCPVFSHHEAHR